MTWSRTSILINLPTWMSSRVSRMSASEGIRLPHQTLGQQEGRPDRRRLRRSNPGNLLEIGKGRLRQARKPPELPQQPRRRWSPRQRRQQLLIRRTFQRLHDNHLLNKSWVGCNTVRGVTEQLGHSLDGMDKM
jgi:hypothetical protein